MEAKLQKDINQTPVVVKDMIKDKSDKLAAATYLVTNFLDDLDQVKWKLRHKSLDLKANLTPSVGSVWPIEKVLSDISELVSLIDIAVLDRRASAMNFSILRQGYLGLQTEFQNYVNGDWYKNALIPSLSSVSFQLPNLSLQPTTEKTVNLSHPKEVGFPLGSPTSKNISSNNRREKIVSFIKQHNWSSIKDVAKFVPNVGAKTIQRELADLVRTGVLKKTGERRWSRYAVN